MDERVIARRRLVLEHITRRSADLPRCEGNVEIVLVDDAAARGVDEQQLRIRRGKHRRVDEAARGIAERDAHVHEVGAAKELLQCFDLLVAPRGAFSGRAVRIPAQDAHIKCCAQNIRHPVGNVARADKAKRTAGHLMADEFLCAEMVETPGTQTVIDKFQLPVERQQLRHGKLRDRRCAKPRHIRNRNAELGGGSGVDRVAADPVHGDDLQIRRVRDDRPRHRCAADDHGGKPLGVVEIVHDLEMARQPCIRRRRDVFTQINFHNVYLPGTDGKRSASVTADLNTMILHRRQRGKTKPPEIEHIKRKKLLRMSAYGGAV